MKSIDTIILDSLTFIILIEVDENLYQCLFKRGTVLHDKLMCNLPLIKRNVPEYDVKMKDLIGLSLKLLFILIALIVLQQAPIVMWNITESNNLFQLQVQT